MSTTRVMREGVSPVAAASVHYVTPGFLYGGPATTSMTGQWFAAAEAGHPVFYGDTEKRWSWVHVDDLAQAYVGILDNPAIVDGETFVIARRTAAARPGRPVRRRPRRRLHR
ncbi:NAD-dependent epimerase/dehydratase family protein [Streptomyces sp. NBC_00191]|uniref:NAD-dependent epimerase/dehydratase family protein n=1 Tax=Streptomyces sp. NBC_00191 TaxID=2975674 RepID=UPI0032452882